MIIEVLLDLVYKLLSTLLTTFDVPPAPEEFLEAIPQYFSYLESAKSLVALVLPVNLAAFLAVTLVIMSVEHGYPFIMWVLRKIPFLGIE